MNSIFGNDDELASAHTRTLCLSISRHVHYCVDGVIIITREKKKMNETGNICEYCRGKIFSWFYKPFYLWIEKKKFFLIEKVSPRSVSSYSGGEYYISTEEEIRACSACWPVSVIDYYIGKKEFELRYIINEECCIQPLG